MGGKIKLSKELIVNEALEIAEKEGFPSVTMATISRSLSIKSPSLYNYFNGLAEIHKAMALSAMDHLFEWLHKKTADKASGKEKIHALSVAYISFGLEHPGFYEATLKAPDPLDKEIQKSGERIVTLSTMAFDSYYLKEVDQVHLVRGLRSILHGMVDLHQKNGFQLSVSLEESLKVIVETYILGIIERYGNR